MNNSTVKGVIKDNNDPEKKGRVKIRFDTLHEGVEDKDLPWVKERQLPIGTILTYRGSSIKLNENGYYEGE